MDLFEDAATAQAFASKQILMEGDTPAKLIELVSNARTFAANGMLRILANSPKPLACKEGCSYCCHLFVEASVPEVLVIAGYILTMLSPEDQERISLAIDAYLEASQGLDYEGLMGLNLPCPLLHEHRCTVYPHRPLSCQRWHSLDVNHCRAYAENPSSGTGVPTNPLVMIAHTAVETGLQFALRDQKLPWQTVSFVAALKLALDDPDVAYTWRSQPGAFDSFRLDHGILNPEMDQIMKHLRRRISNRPGWKDIQPTSTT